LGKGDGHHGADHVAGKGYSGESTEDAHSDQDSTDELRQAVNIGKEFCRLEMVGLEINGLAVDARLVKGSKEGSRAVINKNPRESSSNEKQRNIAGEGRFACVAKPRRHLIYTHHDVSHEDPSVLARRVKG
jgi:hypothetical protein